MMLLKNAVPPSSKYTLIFPLNLKKFCFERIKIEEIQVLQYATSLEIYQILETVENKCDNFILFLRLKYTQIISFLLFVCLLTLGIIFLIIHAIHSKDETQKEFDEFTDNPTQKIIENQWPERLKACGIAFTLLSFIQLLICGIFAYFLTKKAMSKYQQIINKILTEENMKHQINTLTWVLGDQCLWLELRLDYKMLKLVLLTNDNEEQINDQRQKCLIKKNSLQDSDKL